MPWGYAASAVGSYLASSQNSGGGAAGYAPPAGDIKGQNNNFMGNFNQYADVNAQMFGAVQPAIQQGYTAQASNPYAKGSILGAAQGGQMMQNTGQMAAGSAQQLQGAANQYYQTAFDPQSSLYNQYSNQNAEATNAQLANS